MEFRSVKLDQKDVPKLKLKFLDLSESSFWIGTAYEIEIGINVKKSTLIPSEDLNLKSLFE